MKVVLQLSGEAATVTTAPGRTRSGSMPHEIGHMRFCRNRTPRPCTKRGLTDHRPPNHLQPRG
jgi:hypothetical protein